MSEQSAGVQELDMAEATGLWLVSSSGPTRYFLDVDVTPALCMRATGPGTRSSGSTDDRWAPVMMVRSLAPDGAVTSGVLRVGERTLWDLDDGDDVVWWLQRTTTSITPVRPEDRPVDKGPSEGSPEPAEPH